jgi:O-antigen ligase
LATGALCLAAAWLITVSSPKVVFAGAAAAVGAILTLRRPAVGALLMLCLLAVVPRSTLFGYGLPVAGGAMKITDALLALTLVAWVGHVALRGSVRLPPASFAWPFAGFLLLVLFSLLTARQNGTPMKLSLLELRPLLSYLLILPVVDGVRRLRDLERGVGVLLLVGAIAAAEITLRYLRGEGITASFTEDAQRVILDIFPYVLGGVIWAVVSAAFEGRGGRRTLYLLLASAQVAALFFTFQRGAWVALAGGLVTGIVLMPSAPRRRLLSMAIPLAMVGVALISLTNRFSVGGTANPLRSGVERVLSLGAYGHDVSNQHRIAEGSAAVQTIRAHPATGIGLGSTITFRNPEFSKESQQYGANLSAYYIHNSYLWIPLKLGLIAALLFFGAIALCARQAFAAYRRARSPRLRRLLLGTLSSLGSVLLLSATGPHLNVDSSVPFAAAMLAFALVIPRLMEESS